MVERVSEMRMLWDMDVRASMLKQWPEVQQVLTLISLPPEATLGPDNSPLAARVANGGLTENCARWPSRMLKSYFSAVISLLHSP